MMFLKHCSDEQLVASMDGELSRLAERAVRRHLNVCYRCRGRLREFEEQALWLAKAVEQDDFPGPAGLAVALQSFADWERSVNLAPPPPRFSLLPARLSARLAAVCAGIAILCLAIIPWRPHKPEETPAQILNRARAVERSEIANTIHQTMRVEFEQTAPRHLKRTGRLDVWSAAGGARFASRWSDAQGHLQRAVWHPDSRKTYRYDSAVLPHAAIPVTAKPQPQELLDVVDSAPAIDRLETEFLRWLETREWRPVSFTSQLATFAGRQGVALHIEKITLPNSSPGYRLTARRHTAQPSVEITIEIDAQTLRPRLQVIAKRNRGQHISVRFIVEQHETSPRFVNSVFEPDVPLFVDRRPLSSPIETPGASQSDSLLPALPAPAEIARRETQVHYVLHLSHACLGEPIRVTRRDNGDIAVEGITARAERKEELLRALSNLGSPLWLTVNLQTVDEAVGANSSASTATTDVAAADLAVTGADRRLALEDTFLEYLRRQPALGAPGDPAQRLRRFANQAVSRSEAVLAESSALAHLAEAYGHGRLDVLQLQSRWLVQIMIADHLDRMRDRLSSARQLFDPLLAAVPTSGLSEKSQAARPSGSWDGESLEALDAVRHTHQHVLALFTLGYPMPVELSPEGSPTQQRIAMKTPAAAARDLLLYWRELEAAVTKIRTALDAEFSIHRRRPAPVDRAPVETTSKTINKESIQ
ncbi:MAG: hypothetical protein IT168_04100 [Bryobacterales bacterium]|nr:hypothetical protein [Bryobacterales bacterium]